MAIRFSSVRVIGDLDRNSRQDLARAGRVDSVEKSLEV